MAKERQITAQSWGTLEELLLACAVNRHGTKSWDSVAVELRDRRSSAVSWLTPQLCRDKFKDLSRRFVAPNDVDLAPSGLVPMVDQLRRMRVEELRREVRQRDDSIVSLELKVKKLEEERERSVREKADLARNADLSAEIVADEESGERDNRSFNESNSTSQKMETEMNERNDAVEADKGGEGGKAGVNPELDVGKYPDPGQPEIDPTEGRVDDDDDNRKQSSDVQSSATLSKKKRRRSRGGGQGGNNSREEPERDEVSPANKRASAVKSEPLIKLIEMIRSHRLGSAFERRQRSQEPERYKSLIRQPIDLQTIQSRLDKGLYTNSPQKFLRDLLLLLNNFTVFYGKDSQEHIAGKELLGLVRNEMLTILPLSKPVEQPAIVKPEPDKNTVLLAATSSVKTLSENAGRKGDKKEKDVVEKLTKVVNNEKKVDDDSLIRKKTGQRKSRSSKSGREVKHEYGGNELSSHDPLEIKMDKKESVAKKKQGAASFLKRMKQNSPSAELTTEDDDLEEDVVKDMKGEKKGRGRKTEVVRKEKDDSEEDVVKDLKGEEEKGRGRKTEVVRKEKDDSEEDVVKDVKGEEEKKGRGRKTEVVRKEKDDSEEDVVKDVKGEEEKNGRGRKTEVVKKEKVTRSSGGRGAREESGRGKKAVGRPPKRAAAEAIVKKGRENGESEAGSRGRKRARR